MFGGTSNDITTMLQFNRGKLTVEARAEVLAFFQCTFEGWYGEFYNR